MSKIKGRFIPCHDVVFSLMFEDSELFTRLIKAVTGKEIELLDKPFSQISKRENVSLASIRIDLFANTTSGVFSVDMQRRIDENLADRILCYACRMISVQKVEDMQYSDLEPVSVSFIMTDKTNDSENAIRYVKAAYTDTGEPFSELINIALVYVNKVRVTEDTDSELRIFAEFFSINDDSDWETFEKTYKDTDLGGKLMRKYSKVTLNEEALRAFANEPYYDKRDDNKIIVKSLLSKFPHKFTAKEVAEAYGLSLDEIRTLSE
jgi:predicted transposase/invertase (TIGR01784 family)